jgi:predicted nuclease with RNAse H fold
LKRSKIFFGVDLAAKLDNATGIAAISENRELIFVNEVKPDVAILNYVDYYKPAVIGFDAPMSIPTGKFGTYASRQCDRNMMRLGIPTFSTSMLAALTFRALTLRKIFSPKYDLIEVYPYATKIRLGFDVQEKKAEIESRKKTQNKLSKFIKNIPHASKLVLSDDEIDAIFAAYTAMLFHNKLTEPVGDAEEGYINIPIIDFKKHLKD